jgi:hypothetical protein
VERYFSWWGNVAFFELQGSSVFKKSSALGNYVASMKFKNPEKLLGNELVFAAKKVEISDIRIYPYTRISDISLKFLKR